MDARMAPSTAVEGAVEPGVVDAGVYAGGKRVANTSVDEAGAWSKKPGHVVWIGLFATIFLLR